MPPRLAGPQAGSPAAPTPSRARPRRSGLPKTRAAPPPWPPPPPSPPGRPRPLPPLGPPPRATAPARADRRRARHGLRARERAGRPAGGRRTRVEALRRTIREHAWSPPGRRDPSGPAPAPFTAVKAALGDTTLVAYLRDGPALRALVVVDGSASLATLGGYAAAAASVPPPRADPADPARP